MFRFSQHDSHSERSEKSKKTQKIVDFFQIRSVATLNLTKVLCVLHFHALFKLSTSEVENEKKSADKHHKNQIF